MPGRGLGLCGLLLLAAGAFVALTPAPARAQVPPPAPSLVPPGLFRVCAGPADLPSSNRRGEGYDNRIVALIAKAMGRKVSYVWYPTSSGFLRQTLRKFFCDVVPDVMQSSNETLNTDPYYHSGYVVVTRKDAPITIGNLSDSVFRGKRIGVIAGTPPATLVEKFGLTADIVSYHLHTDTRFHKPARQILLDLAKGKIDVALDWGPIAGYYIARDHLPLTWVLLRDNPAAGEPKLDFYVSLGVRRTDQRWAYDLSKVIDAHRPQITHILQSYHVPLLNDQGDLIPPPKGSK